jgi:hypothetical protein
MARIHYYIVHHEGAWGINVDGKIYGPYHSQALAISEAVATAHKNGQSGHDAQVIVQGRDGKWQTEWTYGHDPYPPKG